MAFFFELAFTKAKNQLSSYALLLLLADLCRTITLDVHTAGLFGHSYAQDASQQFAEDIDVWNGRRWKTSQVDR